MNKLSVALCTYNGARFLKEQICSILEQTYPVDEIVVCDDGSSDETILIIERIKERSPIEIRIYRNETNLGVCANFQKAIRLCSGDIVFLSDQDDVWYPNKTKTIVDWFDSHPNKSVVFTDGNLIDGEGRAYLGRNGQKRLWDYFFVPIDKLMFEKGLELECMMHPHATGATMAIKKAFLDDNPFAQYCDNFNVFHDFIISIKAVELGRLGYIDDSLISYRVYEDQQVGVDKRAATENTMEGERTDWREAYYPYDFVYKLLQDPLYKERIGFLNWRIWTKHRLYGPLVIARTWKKYKKYYGKNYCSIMIYDARASMSHSFKRLKNRIIHPFL